MKSKNTSNLIFSAFLVIAFTICSYFFEGIIKSSTGMGDDVKNLLLALVFVVFGLFLFYATRVGEGKQVKRFSPATLIIMDIPALYIILASIIEVLPFSQQISSSGIIVYIASIVLGYGIPYTFFSGYEIDADDDESGKDEKVIDETEELSESETDDENIDEDNGEDEQEKNGEDELNEY